MKTLNVFDAMACYAQFSIYMPTTTLELGVAWAYQTCFRVFPRQAERPVQLVSGVKYLFTNCKFKERSPWTPFSPFAHQIPIQFDARRV